MKEILREILQELKKINEYVDYKKKEELRNIQRYREFPSPSEGFLNISNHIRDNKKGF